MFFMKLSLLMKNNILNSNLFGSSFGFFFKNCFEKKCD
jgi:hypothetical protein